MTISCNSLFYSRMHCKTAMLSLLVALFFLPATLHAQCDNNSTQGTDFWVMFLSNHGNFYNSLSLIAACDSSTTITVTNPRTSWSTQVNLAGPGSVTIPIPVAQGKTEDCDVKSDGGIHVTSSQPISLYASNFTNASYDIATIFPSSVLSSSYMAQTYVETQKAEVGFVAVEDSTVLTMTLPSPVSEEGHQIPQGPHSVMLMRGQSYQLMASDFSGMTVTSNDKPFAMFQGASCTFVGDCAACDHLYEQCFPTEFWGRQYLLIPTAGRISGDILRVTALDDNCRLTLDEDSVATLMSGETYLFELSVGEVNFLQCSSPVTACLYLKGGSCNDSLGDPASVIIPSTEFGVKSAVFQSVNTPHTTLHYANIVVPTYATGFMKIDDSLIADQFIPHPSGLSYAQLPITPGTHTLSNTLAGFEAYFYGLGPFESYAYIVGAGIFDFSESLYIDTIEVRTYTDRITHCQGVPLTLRVDTDEDDLWVNWAIDSQWVAYSNLPVTTVLDSLGTHVIEARFHECDTLNATVDIMPRYRTEFRDTICFNQVLHWRGHTLDSMGLYVDTLASAWGCDSLIALDLNVIAKPHSSFSSIHDCHTGTHILSATLDEADGWPFHWSSQPHDTFLDGHETDTTVIVKPSELTLYRLNVDYRCPFVLDSILLPVEWPGANWEVHPDRLTYRHPWFDAYDRSLYETHRQWLVDYQPLAETGEHLRHEVSSEADSVLLMLVVSNSTCVDTLRRTLPFSHSVQWAPSVFIPDADANNRFAVILDDSEADELLIYNRNGILVRRLPGPDPVWDGTSADGAPCPQSAYVWLLRYRSDDHPSRLQTLTGTVTLLR